MGLAMKGEFLSAKPIESELERKRGVGNSCVSRNPLVSYLFRQIETVYSYEMATDTPFSQTDFSFQRAVQDRCVSSV